MENYVRQNLEEYNIIKNIYKKAIEKLFKSKEEYNSKLYSSSVNS